MIRTVFIALIFVFLFALLALTLRQSPSPLEPNKEESDINVVPERILNNIVTGNYNNNDNDIADAFPHVSMEDEIHAVPSSLETNQEEQDVVADSSSSEIIQDEPDTVADPSSSESRQEEHDTMADPSSSEIIHEEQNVVTDPSSSENNHEEQNTISVPMGTLHNGVSVPLVGLGCASGVRQNNVWTALLVGYRFLDTAQSYNWGYHEDEVGTALRAFREETNNERVFLQTKIHPEDLGYEATKRAVHLSLQRLQVDRIDSVLIHKPHCWEGACTKTPEGTWQDSWKALEEFYESGIIAHSIGICDISDDHLLDELLAQRIKPHIIQNWMDPLHQDVYMRRKIQSHGILYQAYSSLGTQWKYKGYNNNPVLNHPLLLEIAANHGADVGQVVVQWATIRHGVSVLPASTNAARQEGNLRNSFSFTLSENELDWIDSLDGKPPRREEDAVDNNAVKIEFRGHEERTVDVFWFDREGNEEVHVGSVTPGRVLSLDSYHGHTFRFRDRDQTAYHDLMVVREAGVRQVHVIVPYNEEL
eukprot:CAMPEP_0172368266 /NCGR_PEP_ID=MMETSP1060-20121228/26065_1 /TAXON_ID=37318 /ORGANISM="Pseudo-nitzschia pungens, Strain cf. cingulata" /LENGTH=532 /DNA_ID=CAMNT_0013092789 /DNA_START=62 /DNA_END=1660 /DNA_ORIENTATION=-